MRATGAELALEDAETLLMHAKKEVLALEMKLHEAMKQKSAGSPVGMLRSEGEPGVSRVSWYLLRV